MSQMSASEFIPEGGGLKAAREAAAGCRGCHLYELRAVAEATESA